MKKFNLKENFERGWLVGSFDNPILKTDQFEVCVKHFKAGDKEDKHYHKLTTETTIVISGVIEMCNQRFEANDIIVLSPNEESAFLCIEDAITCAFRDGSYPKDKYLSKT